MIRMWRYSHWWCVCETCRRLSPRNPERDDGPFGARVSLRGHLLVRPFVTYLRMENIANGRRAKSLRASAYSCSVWTTAGPRFSCCPAEVCYCNYYVSKQTKIVMPSPGRAVNGEIPDLSGAKWHKGMRRACGELFEW